MTLELQIEEEFLSKLYALDTQDEFYKARKSSLEIKKKELDAVFLMKKPRQKNIKKFNKDISPSLPRGTKTKQTFHNK